MSLIFVVCLPHENILTTKISQVTVGVLPSWLFCDLVWNMAVRYEILINVRLNLIELHACDYILGCSVTTCDEPVYIILGFET